MQQLRGEPPFRNLKRSSAYLAFNPMADEDTKTTSIQIRVLSQNSNEIRE
jgi:hypothetical protein